MKSVFTIFLITVSALVCNVAALELAEKTTGETASMPEIKKKPVCGFSDFEFPDEFMIFAAGAYSGRKLGVQIDQSGHEGTQIDVTVNYEERPVVLLLGAYEPTIWNISWTAGTRIAAVVAGGFHRQAIAGLAPGTPTLTEGYDNHGACGYFYVTPNTTGQLNSLSNQLFHRPVDGVYFADKGQVLIGKPVLHKTQMEQSSLITPEMYYVKDAPPAGRAGLEEALSRGQLRRATVADAQEWADRSAKYAFEKDGVPMPTQRRPKNIIMRDNAYVVLKPFTYPSGLYGDNAATFFIPDGVPAPKGNPGHSAIFDFNTLH